MTSPAIDELRNTFSAPPREYTVIPFWFLNDELTEEELKRQLDDFAAHGVYGVIPHARMGLSPDVGFMSERWLHLIGVIVEHADRKNMYVILYDEGMYPSGSCAGQVVAENPRFATRCLERRRKGPIATDEELVAEDDGWAYVHTRSHGTIRGVHYGEDDREPGAPPSADLINPDAMAAFRRLVLDRYHAAIKDRFGKTVIGIFTDEPNLLGRDATKNVMPWTWGFADFLKETLGYDFLPHLVVLWDNRAPDAERLRGDFDRAVEKRLDEVYYAPYGRWCEEHGVALAGHPAGPGDIGVLRHFQIPGQDVVWRYIEPYQAKSIEGDQSTMAKCSASAQRHYGRKRNMNECFGAYGWEFTYEEMMYITNWLLVRGVNMIVPHAFYYSLRDKRRDERPPDVGPNSPWWPQYATYAAYCRRLCWLLAEGVPECPFAILGAPAFLPWRAARAMFESQHDFNYLDTNTLKTQCKISAECISIRDMHYKALIVDGPALADEETWRVLKPMIDAGRVIAYVDACPVAAKVAPDAPALAKALDELVFPDVILKPANPYLRYRHLRLGTTHAYLFANEGKETIEGDLHIAPYPPGEWWDPITGRMMKDTPLNRLVLPPLAMRVLVA